MLISSRLIVSIRTLNRPLPKSTTEELRSLYFHQLESDDDDVETEEDPLTEKYKKSSLVKKLKKKISKRLALEETISLKEIKSLYQLCAFDFELYNGNWSF